MHLLIKPLVPCLELNLVMMKNLIGICLTLLTFLSGYTQDVKVIEEYMNRMENLGFSGVVLIANGSEIVLNNGYGYSDRNSSKKVSHQSVFSTGSITKQFTATAIMRLFDKGLINPDDKLGGYFPNLPADKEGITIHQMLTHTSGFPLALGGDFEQIQKEDFINQAFSQPLEFKPGSGFQYSNVGYSLLACLVEKISERSYEEFLREEFFKPLNMNMTGYNLPNWQKADLVNIYNGQDQNGSMKRFTNPTWHLIGNGGILSTTEDMFKWVQALKRDKVISEKAKEMMFTPERNDYGYGWDILDGGGLIQHNGGSTLGCGAELRWFKYDELLSIVMTNSTINGQLGFMVIRGDLEALLFEEDIPMPPAVDPYPKDMSGIEGKYKHFEIAVFDNKSALLKTDNQDFLDFLLQPDNYANGKRLFQLNAEYSKAFQKAKTGDYSAFKFMESYEELVGEIKNEMQLAQIETPVFKVVKSFALSTPKGAIMTEVALNDKELQQENLVLRIISRDNKYLGINVGFGGLEPSSFSLIPTGEEEYLIYDSRSKIQGKIQIKDAKEDSLLIINSGVSLSSERK